MTAKRIVCALICAFLCGCTNIEGLYAPACIAYEGDEIQLLDGRYSWRRFTDQRKLDEHGKLVDLFPGYPRSGAYEYRDSVLVLTSGDGSEETEFFLLDENSGIYLLSEAEKRRVEAGDRIPECALRRAAEDQTELPN